MDKRSVNQPPTLEEDDVSEAQNGDVAEEQEASAEEEQKLPEIPVLNTHPDIMEFYIGLHRETGITHIQHPPNLLSCIGLVHMALDMLLMKLKGVPMDPGQPQIHRAGALPRGLTPPGAH